MLHFTGTTDQAVKSYFERLVGGSGNIDKIPKGAGKELWVAKTQAGNITLRNFSTSAVRGNGDKWTIDFAKDILNPNKLDLKKVKFY